MNAWLAVGTIGAGGEPSSPLRRSRSSDASPNARCCSRSPSSSPPDTARSCRSSARPGSASRASSTRWSPRSTTARPDVSVIQGECAPYGESNVWWPIAHGLAGGMGLQLDQPAAEVREIVAAATRPRCTACRPTRTAVLQRGRGVAPSARSPVGARRARHHRCPRRGARRVDHVDPPALGARPGRRVDRRSPVGAPAAARTARADGAQPRRQPAAHRHGLPAGRRGRLAATRRTGAHAQAADRPARRVRDGRARGGGRRPASRAPTSSIGSTTAVAATRCSSPSSPSSPPRSATKTSTSRCRARCGP